MSQTCFVKPLCTVSICCCNLQFLLITLRQIGQVFVCPSCTHCLCLCKLDMVPNEFPPRETKKKSLILWSLISFMCKDAKLASAISAIALVVFLPRPRNRNWKHFGSILSYSIDSRPKSTPKVRNFC